MVKFDLETSDIEAVFAHYMQDARSSKLPALGAAVCKERAKNGCVVVMPTKPCP
jgi:hypothetical protein